MLVMKGCLVLLIALCSVTFAAPAADEILSLPGWTGALPSKQYSGYLSIAGGTNLHYFLVTSENSPETAPTILWLNGGPGCSSLDGWTYEMGPFIINADNTLTERPYRWNRLANMLFIEAPVGVGFSYSDNLNYTCDDDRTALENRLAIEKFFQLFPEYKANPFFITGESYAGIYVPTLAEAIVKGEKDGSYTGAKLKGIAVGNGCSGDEIGICGHGPQGTYYEWLYLLSTAFVDRDLKTKINAVCNWTAAEANLPDALSPACVVLLNQAHNEISNVNLYNIYGDCVSGGCSGSEYGKIPTRPAYTTYETVNNITRAYSIARIMPGGPDACIDSVAASAYFNQPSVMAAIHVKPPGFCWSVCSSARGWSYSSTRANLPRDTYPLLIANIRVIIYNGDWDSCVPYTDNEHWTQGMGLPLKKQWHPWTYTSVLGHANQVAGYATQYDVTGLGGGSFEFITVKGGRHEVPETAPAQALEMVTRMINAQPF